MHTIRGLAGCTHRFNVLHLNAKTSTLEDVFFFADPEVNDQGFGAAAIDNVFWIGAREVRDLLSRFRPGPGVVESVNPLVELERFGNVFGWQDGNKSFHSA